MHRVSNHKSQQAAAELRSACPKAPRELLAPSGQERGPPMKCVIGTAVAAIVFLAVLAGKDDIRRFRRMQRM